MGEQSRDSQTSSDLLTVGPISPILEGRFLLANQLHTVEVGLSVYLLLSLKPVALSVLYFSQQQHVLIWALLKLIGNKLMHVKVLTRRYMTCYDPFNVIRSRFRKLGKY